MDISAEKLTLTNYLAVRTGYELYRGLLSIQQDVNDLRDQHFTDEQINTWIKEREELRGKVQDAAARGNMLSLVKEIEAGASRPGYSSVRTDLGIITEIQRRLVDPPDETGNEYWEGLTGQIVNKEIRDAIVALGKKEVENVRQKQKADMDGFHQTLKGYADDPDKLIEYLSNYSQGRKSDGTSIRNRDPRLEERALVLLSQIQDIENSAEKFTYDEFKENRPAMEKAAATRFENDPAREILEFVSKKVFDSAFDRVVVKHVGEITLNLNNYPEIVTALESFQVESPTLRALLGFVRKQEETARRKLRDFGGLKLSELETDVWLPVEIGMGDYAALPVAGKLATGLSTLLNSEKKKLIEEARKTVVDFSETLYRAGEKEATQLFDRAFAESSGVRLGYGEHWESAQNILLNSRLEELRTMSKAARTDGLTALEIEEARKNLEAHGLIVQKFKGHGVGIKAVIEKFHDAVTVSGLVDSVSAFCAERSTGSPPMVSELTNPAYVKKKEKLPQHWAGQIVAVMLERIRLGNPNHLSPVRVNSVKEALGLPHPHYLGKSEASGEFIDKYFAESLQIARRHMTDVGFTESQVNQAAEGLFLEPGRQRLVRLADVFFFDESGKISLIDTTDFTPNCKFTHPEGVFTQGYATSWEIGAGIKGWYQKAHLIVALNTLSKRTSRLDGWRIFDLRLELPVRNIFDMSIFNKFKQYISPGFSSASFDKEAAKLVSARDFETTVGGINLTAQEVLRELLSNSISVAEITGIDANTLSEVEWVDAVLNLIAGKYGQKEHGCLKQVSNPRGSAGVLRRNSLELLYNYGKKKL